MGGNYGSCARQIIRQIIIADNTEVEELSHRCRWFHKGDNGSSLKFKTTRRALVSDWDWQTITHTHMHTATSLHMLLFCCQHLDVTNDQLPVNHGGYSNNELCMLGAIKNNEPVWCIANLKLFRNYRKDHTGLDPSRSTEGKVLHTMIGLCPPPQCYGLFNSMQREKKWLISSLFSF